MRFVELKTTSLLKAISAPTSRATRSSAWSLPVGSLWASLKSEPLQYTFGRSSRSVSSAVGYSLIAT